MRDFEVEVMRRVHNQKLAPKPNLNTNLVTHRGSVRMNRLDLKTLPTPEATDTFKPIPHYSLMTMIEEALAYRHIGIEKEEYAVSSDGMKLFGLMELSFSTNEVRFALGIRTSNDKSMRLSMVAGYRVFICDNMAFSGEFKPLLAKHLNGTRFGLCPMPELLRLKSLNLPSSMNVLPGGVSIFSPFNTDFFIDFLLEPYY